MVTEEIVVKRCKGCRKKWFAVESEVVECECGEKVV